MATPQPVTPSTSTQYQFDTGGNLIPVSKQHPLRGSFAGFYNNRTELTGTPKFDVDWRNLNRPGVDRFEGRAKKSRSYKAGRGFQEEPKDWGEPQEQDISGFASAPRPSGPGKPGEQFEPIGIGPRSGYNLTNARNVTTPGTAVESANTWPSQSFAGGSGSWGRVSNALGSQPAIGSQRAIGSPAPAIGRGSGTVIDATSR